LLILFRNETAPFSPWSLGLAMIVGVALHLELHSREDTPESYSCHRRPLLERQRVQPLCFPDECCPCRFAPRVRRAWSLPSSSGLPVYPAGLWRDELTARRPVGMRRSSSWQLRGAWSADILGRLSASRAIVTRLVTHGGEIKDLGSEAFLPVRRPNRRLRDVGRVGLEPTANGL